MAYLYKDPKVLLIGIGGGTIIVQLNKLLGTSLQLEAVDVNKGIVEMAKEYFLYNIPLNYTIMDGAEYVSSKNDRYNLIILDAFQVWRFQASFLGTHLSRMQNLHLLMMAYLQ